MKKRFAVTDHSVTQEEFELVYNEEFEYYKTTPQPSTIDLPKYYKSEDYISHTDNQRNLAEKLYHIVRSYSFKKKIRLINKFASNQKTLLDVGCGTGDFLKKAHEAGWNINGIEPDSEARKIANAKTQQKVYDIEKMQDFKFGYFDVITLWHVLEHLPDLDKQITTLKSLLNVDGRLIIAVPNYNSYDAKLYMENWAAFDVPRHLWHFSKNSISKIFSKHGMEVEKHIPLKFDSYYVSLLSEKHKTGRLNIIKGFSTGLLSNLKALVSGEYSSLIYVIKRLDSANKPF